MKNPFTETSGDNISAKMSSVQLEETMKSNLCAKAEEESDGLITSTINGKMYRHKLNPDQLFHCSETGIKFQVKSTATIEYELEYGADYKRQIEENGYEIVGPLFKINVVSGAVSAVYLPHYLCLEDLGGDKSLIKCVHFKDGKMSLQTPDKIEPSNIMLENPTFSCVAPLMIRSHFWKLRKKYTPIHGKVLLYFRVVCPEVSACKLYRIHLYLIPRGQPQIKKLDKLKKEFGFKRVDKPPQTRNSLNTKTDYTIDGGRDVDLSDKILKLKIHDDLEKYPYIEVNVKGDATEILLSLKEKDNLIWNGKLTEGDLRELTFQCIQQKGNFLPKESFLIKHRQVLISEVTKVELVLDHLLAEKLLTGEEYDFVLSKQTSQEQMRALYGCVKSWGDDDQIKLYKILKITNGPLIRKLKKLSYSAENI
ncbi:NACHT, LRR and PYD domains-containing protein 1b allele 2-like [Mixophyes fleayi]|uniref:NACHT, LRR and PYD domains-containing protein 1b allele 2-like n=1 Tax=Mixophyes fleayi TaxID=3061075 RepID=UPI003F4D8748